MGQECVTCGPVVPRTGHSRRHPARLPAPAIRCAEAGKSGKYGGFQARRGPVPHGHRPGGARESGVGDGDLLVLDWRKSSACDPVDCVEVALMARGVRVRESTRPEGNVISVGAVAWRDFLGALCARTLEGPL
ncbi:DUF397 domain-containing protein [Streptomyces sp. NBC_01604]|uniref:DUF397 domain-containing protein n=1 Tax=Streptomyces sp. NBC_01604 TaxID=2975894 RepID=UPI00386E34CD